MTKSNASARSERIEQLLQFYPNIGPAESDEILHFLKKGSHLEVGLLGGKDSIRPQLEAFRRDHKKRFSLSPRDYLLFVLATCVPLIAVCWYVWSRAHIA